MPHVFRHVGNVPHGFQPAARGRTRGFARYVLPALVAWAIVAGHVSATPLENSVFGSRRAAAAPHPAVVRVIVPEGHGVSLGSGSLVAVNDRHGLVITNWHVIRDAGDRIEVVFPDGFRSEATLLAADRDWDLAALAIWRPNVRPIPLAQQAPWPGDPLTIAGYGSGRYRTATGRCVQYVSPGEDLPFEMVELAAGAREGDSGGPILNQRGELAGVLFGATWGRTAGSHTAPVQRFLASVANRFDSLPQAHATLAQLPQSDDSRDRQPAQSSSDRPHRDPRPFVPEPNPIRAHASLRIAANAGVPATALNVDGWVASGQADDLAVGDRPQTAPLAHPRAGASADFEVDLREPAGSRSPQSQTPASPLSYWPSLLGSTRGEQLKNLLAAVGLCTLLFQMWRMLGNG